MKEQTIEQKTSLTILEEPIDIFVGDMKVKLYPIRYRTFIKFSAIASLLGPASVEEATILEKTKDASVPKEEKYNADNVNFIVKYVLSNDKVTLS